MLWIKFRSALIALSRQVDACTSQLVKPDRQTVCLLARAFRSLTVNLRGLDALAGQDGVPKTVCLRFNGEKIKNEQQIPSKKEFSPVT